MRIQSRHVGRLIRSGIFSGVEPLGYSQPERFSSDAWGARPPRLPFGAPSRRTLREKDERSGSGARTAKPTTRASLAAPGAGALPIFNCIVPAQRSLRDEALAAFPERTGAGFSFASRWKSKFLIVSQPWF